MLANIKKITSLFTKSEKKNYKYLIFLMVVGGVLELLSISFAYQIIRIFSLGENIFKDQFTLKFITYFNLNNFGDILFIFSIFLLLIFLIKLIFVVSLNFLQNKFIFNLQSNLISRLYSLYINKNYSFYLTSNSAKMIRNLKDEISLYCVAVVQSLSNILLEIFLIILIVFFLFYLKPEVVLSSISFLILFSSTYYFIIKKKLFGLGLQRQILTEKMLKNIQEGINGIRDIKILNKEKIFVEFLKQITNKMANVSTYLITLQQFPRVGLEFIIVLVFVALITFTDINETNYTNTIQTIGLFAIASFRMLPSINKILVSLQNIRSTLPAVDVLSSELNNKDENKKSFENKKELIFKDSLALENVSFKYSDKRKFEFNKINLKIKKNKMIGLIGESGSGKSTLVDLIVGLLLPDEGSIKVDGQNINNHLDDWRSKIGYVSQTTYLMDESLEKNIAYTLNEDEIDKTRVNETIRLSELDKVLVGLPDGIKTIVGERGVQLSGGQIQRIGIARALYHNPELLIFDEATSSLDSTTEDKIINTIKNFKNIKTIIIISHRLSAVKHCDKVYNLENGLIK